MSYVCADCIRERWLAEYIKTNADQNECDFCGETSDDPIAIELDDMIEHIRERIECIYEDPANSVGYESAEGGYQLSTMDTYDVLDDVGLSVENDALREELVDGVGRSEWVHRNPYSLPEEDALQMSWESFAETVKHKVRYLMFPIKQHDEYHVREGLELTEVLDGLGDAFLRYEFPSVLKAGTRLYRVRLHEPGWAPENTLDALGPPPVASTRFSNRMSPAGISMFYGALHEDTALQETYVRHDGKPAEATIAVFELVEDLYILNLTVLPEYPSVFGSDEENLDRPTVHFIHSFVQDFTQLVEKDGREHVEYVPSQVVTEYVRYRMGEKAGKPIRGILYPSARHEQGIGCVLFVAHDDINGMFRQQSPVRLLAELTRTVLVDTSPVRERGRLF
jgi:hypothetical protein